MSSAKVIVYTMIAILVLILAIVGIDMLLAIVLAAMGKIFGAELQDSWVVTPLLLFLFALMPKRWIAWNRKYECHGSTVIQAEVEEIWNWLRITPRDDFYNTSLRRIRAVPGKADEFHMMFDDRLKDETSDGFVHIRLIEQIPGSYIHFTTLNADDLPLFGKDHLSTEIFLAKQEDGVKVTYIETLSRITLGSFLAFLLLNPARDSMTSLKAQVEGTQDPSILARMTKEIGPNGEAPSEVDRAIILGGVTAVVFSTALVAALMWFIFEGLVPV